MDSYLYGSVYKVTREDTLENIRKDFEQMSRCEMNTVVIWPPVFYWEEMGPDYPFATGKAILEIARDCGLQVIMELAGQLSVFEYIPDSEMKQEYYALDAHENREWGQDSFGFLNYFHPEVKEKICAMYKKIALAYKDSPALYGYDIFNETMYRSFDHCTMDAFRSWLKDKYGTIEKLNAVWERTYTDFSQVQYEHHKWMSIMPKADYFAFRKAAVAIFLKDWRDAVREVDLRHVLIADNIHSQSSLRGDYGRPQDDYGLKTVADEIGMSFYPKGVGGVFPPAERHQIFSGYADAAEGKGFLISEMQTHIQALFNPTTAVRTYELKQWCYEAYAAGAKALIYWMWRPFSKGLQTAGRGLVDYRARETERYDIAKAIGSEFRKYGAFQPKQASVGVVYDPLSEDFQYLYTEAYSVDQKIYLKSVTGAYGMLFDSNIPCDIIRMGEIGKYPVVLLTNKLVMTAAECKLLQEYVRSGGTVIVDGKFGVVDETSMLYKTLPGGMAYVLCGQDLIDSDYEQLEMQRENSSVPGYYGRDLMKLTDGEAMLTYPDGAPAVVRKHTGAGSVYSINTYLFWGYQETKNAAQRKLVGEILENCGVVPTSSNENVKIRAGQCGEKAAIVVFNYSPEEQTSVVRACGEEKTVRIDGNDAVIMEW